MVSMQDRPKFALAFEHLQTEFCPLSSRLLGAGQNLEAALHGTLTVFYR